MTDGKVDLGGLTVCSKHLAIKRVQYILILLFAEVISTHRVTERTTEVDCYAPEPEVWSVLGPVPELPVGPV